MQENELKSLDVLVDEEEDTVECNFFQRTIH